MLLVTELNEVTNFCQQMSDFSIPFSLENITEIRYEERAFDHFHLLLAHDIFLREILQIESIVLLYFEGIPRYLSTSNKNQLIFVLQYIKCSNVSLSRHENE